MLVPAGNFKVFLYPYAFDMRAGYDRLAYLCQEQMKMAPYSGAVFLFFNKQKDRARIFFYDGSGSCMFSKRLERGRFKVPEIPSGQAYGVVASVELGLLLEGADVSKVKRPRGWLPKTSKDLDQN